MYKVIGIHVRAQERTAMRLITVNNTVFLNYSAVCLYSILEINFMTDTVLLLSLIILCKIHYNKFIYVPLHWLYCCSH